MITTTLEWYTPAEKPPNEGDWMVAMFTDGYFGEFSVFGDLWLSNDREYRAEDVAFWAEMKVPE
jgi:hypothetical protein